MSNKIPDIYKDIGRTYRFFYNKGCIKNNHSIHSYILNINNLTEDDVLNAYNCL